MYILLSCSSAPRPVLRANVNLGANSFLTVTSVAFSCWKHMAALAGGVLFWSRICQTVSQYQQRRFYKLSPALKNEPRHNKMAQWLKTAAATNCGPEFHNQKPHGNSSKLSSDPRNAPIMMNTWKLNLKKSKSKRLNSVTSPTLKVQFVLYTYKHMYKPWQKHISFSPDTGSQ